MPQSPFSYAKLIRMPEKSYQWNAEEYARASAAQLQWAQELIGKLGLRGDEAVLDIGCGDGKISAAIAMRLDRGRVTGVDRSWEMVRLARTRFNRAQHPNLTFAQMDAARLAFQSGFEVAFSNAALHWIRDHRPVLAGVVQCLTSGGRILFQMGGRGNASEIIRAMDTVRARTEWTTYFGGFQFPYGFYGPEEYAGWLNAVGLQVQRIELIPKDMQHAGREGLAAWIRTTWLPYTENVPANQREEFIAQVLDEYLHDHPADAENTIHVQMVRLEVEAIRTI